MEIDTCLYSIRFVLSYYSYKRIGGNRSRLNVVFEATKVLASV